MKKFQHLLTATFFLFSLSFGLQSCDKCKNVDCGAHGTCDKGDCICSDGYTGESCQTSPCANVDCGEHGTCDNGTCACEAGYIGEHCEIVSRKKFIGEWEVDQSCNLAGANQYEIEILEDTAITGVLITNMWDHFFNPTFATISGSKIIIPEQEPDMDDFYISGEGTISDATISMTIILDDRTGSYKDTCTATLTK